MPDLFWLVVSYGLCFFLMHKVPAPVLLDKLLLCPYCTGFHTGWLTWLLAKGVPGSFRSVVLCLCWAFASAASCYLIDTVAKRLERE